MERITAEKVANFVFDNAEIMKRQKAMDAFEKRIGTMNGIELKKKQIELNSAKLEKMDADIFKTRAQAQSTVDKIKNKMMADQAPTPQPVVPQLPKMAAGMPGQSTGGAKPSSFEQVQNPGKTSNPYATSAQRGTDMRQVAEVPDAAPIQSPGAPPTGATPMPIPPPPIQQPTGMPKPDSAVPMNMTAKPTQSPQPPQLPKFAAVSDLSSRKAPNDSKIAFQSKSLANTLRLFPNLRII